MPKFVGTPGEESKAGDERLAKCEDPHGCDAEVMLGGKYCARHTGSLAAQDAAVVLSLRAQLAGMVRRPSDFKPRFQKFEPVHVENKQGGVCHVKDVEETAPGVYRYLIERTETFFAHEQALAKVNKT
jgi:hypothetical protein